MNNKGKNIVNTYDNQKYLINIYIHIVTRSFFPLQLFFCFLLFLLKSAEANLSATLAVQIDFQKVPDKARKIVAPCERKALARDMENEKLPPTNLIPHPGADRR